MVSMVGEKSYMLSDHLYTVYHRVLVEKFRLNLIFEIGGVDLYMRVQFKIKQDRHDGIFNVDRRSPVSRHYGMLNEMPI